MPKFAIRPVGAIALVALGVLLAVSPWYGYHRDELYFRMLGFRPAWGYFDTPPLTPMIARVSIETFGDTVFALRVVPALCLATTVVLAALISRELGGGRVAQIMSAAGVATAVFPLLAGHTLLTLSADMVLWAAAMLFVIRALRRGDGRWWLAVGGTAGIATYNRQLIVLLLIGLAVGLVAVGPRAVFRDRWLYAGAALAVVLAVPNVVYQVTHDWPQLRMAEALDADEGTDNRIMFLPLQVILLGPPLAVIGVVGWLALWRDRSVRAVALAYPVACALTLYSGGRPDYVAGFLMLFFVAGCAPVVGWMRRLRWRTGLVTGALAVNALVAVVLALPVVPASSLPGTPVAAINEVARESVGWPGFVRQIAEVVDRLPPEERARTVIITENYGEAGAVHRWSARYRLPPVYSPHNELAWWDPPPDTTTTVVWVGQSARGAQRWFERCELSARITGMVGEEQDEPVVTCRSPRQPWPEFWRAVRHYS